ncbi:carbohydrate porin [Rubripirellula reticaptiva]|uniref:Carbohydrate-selective porin, OprB family n=1 Tax=Rubripirellula reticaptiva TaxID=2528013 RepID=A0A5C6F3G2_9BACT|nr:carbohydrate porin [Rubripirellula reticaptiva]TWU56343.1 Carbohydrate-selective porin, OprB family [Rubripirellula reticaptiva]
MAAFQNSLRVHRTLVALLSLMASANTALSQFCDDGSGNYCDVSPEGCDSISRKLSCREAWAENGITFSNNLTQFYFGTVDGGLDQTDRYGGHGDYVANFDFGKLGVQEGLFLKLRAEHRFGRSIVEPTGALLPATLAADLPATDSRDLYLTNFVITQALSESFIVFAGKVDTLDGDANAFAHGRGIKQFSNVAFVANPIALRTIPYSSLGVGFAYLLEGEPLLSFLLINPTNTTTSSGFDELFSEGIAVSVEMRVPTNLAGRPGHQLVGATYSNRDYTSLDQDPRIVLPQVPIDRASDSWSLYWNTDQYLVSDRSNPNRGWGYFARAGIADNNTNPISSFLSAGIGGSSMIDGREDDAFGLGYFFYDTSDEIGPFLNAALGGIGDSQGVEAFYNFQANKMLTITPDFQWISQARESVDDAYVLGVRANLAF